MFQRFKKKDVKQSIAASYLINTEFNCISKKDYASIASTSYCANVVAHRAINMIVEAAASVKLIINAAKRKTVCEIEELLKRPNPYQSAHEFMSAIYAHKLLSGNSYILAIPMGERIAELNVLRPDRVKVEVNRSNAAKYVYEINSSKHEFHMSDQGVCNLLHIKSFNPLSDLYGMSSIEPATYSIGQHNLAGLWNQALLQNGARPSGAIVVKGDNLTENQYIKLKESIDDIFSGAKNAGRPIILEGGMEWKEMSLTPKDMDFIESKHSSARDIALALGMPPQLLGIPGDNTYANLQEARLAFWEQTIIPLLNSVIEPFSDWFSKISGKEISLECDFNSVSALSSKRDALWDRVEKCSFLTVDEKRHIVGLTPLKGENK
jgi:HK97 family phage portal protein